MTLAIEEALASFVVTRKGGGEVLCQNFDGSTDWCLNVSEPTGVPLEFESLGEAKMFAQDIDGEWIVERS